MKVIITTNNSNKLIMHAGGDKEIAFIKKMVGKFERSEKILQEFDIKDFYLHINETE